MQWDKWQKGMADQHLTQQKLALIDEVRTSVRLTQLGLAELQRINGANDFYHLPFQLLSSGFERLLKCIVCLKRYEDKGTFPATNEIKKHDLIELLDSVINNCISETTARSRPATSADYDVLKGDTELRRLLSILSEFGKYGRYYNLDIVTSNVKTAVDTDDCWSEYETELVMKDKNLTTLLHSPTKSEELFFEINKIIIAKLEFFARALARQFTLGNLGEEARINTGTVAPFLYLRDSELGTTDYREQRNP